MPVAGLSSGPCMLITRSLASGVVYKEEIQRGRKGYVSKSDGELATYVGKEAKWFMDIQKIGLRHVKDYYLLLMSSAEQC
jgi:hypothetical protein